MKFIRLLGANINENDLTPLLSNIRGQTKPFLFLSRWSFNYPVYLLFLVQLEISSFDDVFMCLTLIRFCMQHKMAYSKVSGVNFRDDSRAKKRENHTTGITCVMRLLLLYSNIIGFVCDLNTLMDSNEKLLLKTFRICVFPPCVNKTQKMTTFRISNLFNEFQMMFFYLLSLVNRICK